MRIVLFVEGQTERKVLPDFLKRWLDARLPEPIGVKTVRFEGWPDYMDTIATAASLNLTGKAAADVVGFGVLDLYGPTFYPEDKKTAIERAGWAKGEIEKRVGQPRFRQHFAVHELEAWLLSDPEIFPADVRTALPGRVTQPEAVNFDEPPAKLLDRIYQARLKRTYRKTVDGVKLFGALSPDRAYQKCPFLKKLLDDIVSVAGACRT